MKQSYSTNQQVHKYAKLNVCTADDIDYTRVTVIQLYFKWQERVPYKRNKIQEDTNPSLLLAWWRDHKLKVRTTKKTE